MQLITLTKLQKKKLKEMVVKLFPEFQYVRFKQHGLISLSKSFWHSLFYSDTVHITELCTVRIPEKLEELDLRMKGDNAYHRAYNQYSHIVLDLLHHRASKIVDYLYDEYIHIKYNIRKVYYNTNGILPKPAYKLSQFFLPRKNDSVVLSRLSDVHIKEALRRWTNVTSVLNHPVLQVKRLNLWFKREIKEELGRILDIRISYA